MLRWLYIQILWAHPAQFRYRFCDEMLEIFDQANGRREAWWLLLDALVSVLRQWTIRREFRRPLEPVIASGDARDLLVLHLIEPYQPRPFALMQGGVIAMLLLLGVVWAINHGGRVRNFLIGAYFSRPGLFAIDRSSLRETDLNTTVAIAPEREDPWRALALPYFRSVRVLSAIDTDGDLAISRQELIAAPTALRQLDTDGDGALSAQECGFRPGLIEPAVAARLRRSFMRENPALAILDANHDNEISAAEISNAGPALGKLDRDHDRSLTPAELLPDRSGSQAAMILTWLDSDDDGTISQQEQLAGNAAPLRKLLGAADRNHDGRVDRAELTQELSLRAELQRQFESARRKLK